MLRRALKPIFSGYLSILPSRLLMKFLIILAGWFAHLPVHYHARLGRGLGWLLERFAYQRRTLVERNLQLVFPDQSPEQCQQMVRQHFAHLGRGLCELLTIWFAQNDRPLALIKQAEVSGLEHWQGVKQQGVILCVFHHTYMESMGLLLGQLGQVHPVYRPQDNPVLEAYSEQARSRWTAGAVSNREVKKMIRLLKQHETLWLAPDQRNRSAGIPIPFMGQRPLTHTSIARIARLSNAKIIPVTCHRTTQDRLALTFHPAIQSVAEKTDAAILTELMQILEQEVRAYPEQYFWVHDRFNLGKLI